MYSQHVTGHQGENQAVRYLIKHGYEILERNVFLRYVEIDIVASKHDVIYFFEVKTRRSTHYGKPVEAISRKKIDRIKRAGLWYVNRFKISYNALSVGVVAIVHRGSSKNEITCIPNVDV